MRRLRSYGLLALLWAGPSLAGLPIFENQTPAGFSPQDSAARTDFAVGGTVSVRVDLNQAATSRYPVIGHFHSLEKSDQVGTTATDGMQVDVAMVRVAPSGASADLPAPGVTSSATDPIIHLAWIEQHGTSQGSVYHGGTTPVYQVMYCRSYDGGGSFDTPVSVSGSVTYHPLTIDGSGTSFSTLDLEVDSGGNPRVVYAFVSTASAARDKNVYLAYSEDGGTTWQSPLRLNNLSQTEGRNCAFPRLAIDDRDNVFVGYVRGSSAGTGTDDVMLAKVDHFTSPFTVVPVGETGSAGSGGVRLTPDGERHTGPDLAVGDDDALHLLCFDDTDDRIEHRRMRTDTTWVDVGASGWNQGADGALVSLFDDEAATNAALETDATFFFPSLAVDRQRLPDRVYALFKYGDNTPVEGIYYNHYDDTDISGTSAAWGTAGPVWNTSSPALFRDGDQAYNVELDWTIAERVAAVVDQRLEDQGDLHIAFSAGYSSGNEHDLYYALYNGSSWTLPEKVADDDSDGAGTQDGIANTDVFLLSPALAWHSGSDNLYLAFAGGKGEGFGVKGTTDVDHHAYFKVLGRDLAWEDESVPVGGYQYTLSYTPVNPQDAVAPLADNPVYVHAADPATGLGLGASGSQADGFLAGDWESVGSTLSDDDKYFEGRIDEDPSSTNEWGDDDDKVGLLVKLNVLGSDSATNLQVVTHSTASAGGTGLGARSVRVGTDPTGSFVGVGAYFLLGADIDISPVNAAPTVAVLDPDGSGDQANTAYAIRYTLADGDDDLAGQLRAAFYYYPTGQLRSVQDIRTFGTLIADENDVVANNPDGTGDLTEGVNQTYTWDDPPAALRNSALFASILRARSGTYYVYLVADDGKNPPVFAVSPGPLTVRHSPVVQQVDPSAADTVDTGVRSGLKADPYDLDFRVIDYDSEVRLQLFYAAASGLASVSARGTYPNQRFVLGKSVAGTRGTAITDSTSLTGQDRDYSWDVSSPLVPEGAYYLYVVATDSAGTTVGQSSSPLMVKHSPSFVFYEPARDTQRRLDTGSQPVYTIQWQKGPGDRDLDHNASIALYFTTDDPAVADHATDAGAAATSLTSDPDTRLIVSGLSEDGDGASDMYAWNLRLPPNSVPQNGQRVWLYAVIQDGAGNVSVARGGSLMVEHHPYILLKSRLPEIDQGDVLRLDWDDYWVDDGSGTDDAYIRLYASTSAGHTTLQSLEASVGRGQTFVVNSADGTATGAIAAIREDSSNSFLWDTRTSHFALPEGTYSLYAGISGDPTFADNATGRLSQASNQLVVKPASGTSPHLSLSPSKVLASAGDTITFEILVQSGGLVTSSVGAVVDLGTSLLSVVSPATPCTDLGEVFSGGTVVENTSSGTKVRFTKNKAAGGVVGTEVDPARLARFRAVVQSGFSGSQTIRFDPDETALAVAGSAVPLKKSTGMAVQNAQVRALPRGRILATVLLEGRAPPLGNGDHSTLLDVHLRLPGSALDLSDAAFRTANDDWPATADTVEVQTTSAGGLSLLSVPAGRYVMTVKDTSHASGRTDTIIVRGGETLELSAAEGFFASDIRGDPSFLLDQDGRELKAGDVTGDNEIDEDDVNAIDAAWGLDSGKPFFFQADLNNDGRVGVEDLTATSSNISNSTGLGAPPVFKRAARGDNGRACLEISAPGYAGQWQPEEEVELAFVARDLDDLAGYDLELGYDPAEVSLVDQSVRAGQVFQDNPQGYCSRTAQAPGRLAVAAARRGREWAAAGRGEVLRVRVRLHGQGFPRSLQLEGGQWLSSDYAAARVRLAGDPALLALPAAFGLGPNYPNPFNPSTTIPFSVPALGRLPGRAGLLPVAVEVYDALGQRVRALVQEDRAPGYYRAVWDGRDSAGCQVGAGVYFYRVRVGEQVQVGKMALVK